VIVAINCELLVSACNCTRGVPANIASLLDCIPNVDGSCLGEEVKCLRKLRQPQLSNRTGSWDSPDSFFNQRIDVVSNTYRYKSHTPCPWSYQLEESSNRYPRYIHNVNCSTMCYSSDGSVAACVCVAVKYTMPILERTDGQKWKIASTEVNVACIPRFVY